MSRRIDTADRITNKTTPIDTVTRTVQNADILMEVFDNLVDGKYDSKIHPGTTATRPATPEVGDIRTNTDFNGIEMYTSYGWLVLKGVWSDATRPSTASLAPGSEGWNVTVGQRETYDGTDWNFT